jgi:hypothetical protein
MNPIVTIHRSLLRLIFCRRSVQAADQAAGEVARQCRDTVWGRVYPAAYNMTAPQIRGYVRALAAASVEAEVDRVLRRRNLSASLSGETKEAAIDQLIGGVIHDVLCGDSCGVLETAAA